MNEVKGTVTLIEEVKEYGAKGFKKRLMVIETDGKFNNTVPVEALGDKADIFDAVSVGDEVTASVNLGGRAWNDRYFPSIECWKITVDSAGGAAELPMDEGDDIQF